MSSTGDPPHSDNPSFFCRIYNIPSIKGNLAQWDTAWEKTLPTLSASEDVYPIVCVILKLFTSVRAYDGHYEAVRKLQKATMDQVEHGETNCFSTAWKLVDEEERKKHILKGMKQACESATFYQDSRAMCPEITTTAMLEQQGMAFLDFARKLSKAIKEEDAEKVYMLPSDWWLSAVNLPQPWSESTLLTFTQLSTARNEFIGDHVLSHTCARVCVDTTLFSSSVRLPQYTVLCA